MEPGPEPLTRPDPTLPYPTRTPLTRPDPTLPDPDAFDPTRPDPTRPGRLWPDTVTECLRFELRDYFDDGVLLVNAFCQMSLVYAADTHRSRKNPA